MAKRNRLWTQEQIATRVAKAQETRGKRVDIVSDTFTISSDGNGWAVSVGSRTLYYSCLDRLCDALLKAKLLSTEAKSVRELREALRSASTEILRSVGKVYPPNCL